HPDPDRVAEELAKPLLRSGRRRLLARDEAPVLLAADAVAREDDVLPGRHRLDVVEEGRLPGVRLAAREEAVDLLLVRTPLLRECPDDLHRLGSESYVVFPCRVDVGLVRTTDCVQL